MTKEFPITNDAGQATERGVHAASTSLGTSALKRLKPIRHSSFFIHYGLVISH
jgi:hypothetical protein